jgi:hypothetical protein
MRAIARRLRYPREAERRYEVFDGGSFVSRIKLDVLDILRGHQWLLR